MARSDKENKRIIKLTKDIYKLDLAKFLKEPSLDRRLVASIKSAVARMATRKVDAEAQAQKTLALYDPKEAEEPEVTEAGEGVTEEPEVTEAGEGVTEEPEVTEE